jgi:hypothetical protein
MAAGRRRCGAAAGWPRDGDSRYPGRGRIAVETIVTHEVGHAHVAAVRVLKYRLGRSPTLEEVAEVLGSQVEITNHRLRALERLGIVAIVENPFESHVSVADYAALEKLPTEVDEGVLAEEVEGFRRRQDEKAAEMMRVFEEGDEEKAKKEKHEQIEEDLRRYKKKPAKKAPWEK